LEILVAGVGDPGWEHKASKAGIIDAGYKFSDGRRF